MFKSGDLDAHHSLLRQIDNQNLEKSDEPTVLLGSPAGLVMHSRG
jgi:hypothetical protein